MGRGPDDSERAGVVLGLLPVAGLLGVCVWLLLVTPRPGTEAGLPPRSLAPTATPQAAVFGAPCLEPGPLLLVTTSEVRAEKLRSLLGAEAALRETLGEDGRVADVVVAPFEGAAAAIIAAINADAALTSNGAAPQVVLLR
jgi:hypothetical protein